MNRDSVLGVVSLAVWCACSGDAHTQLDAPVGCGLEPPAGAPTTDRAARLRWDTVLPPYTVDDTSAVALTAADGEYVVLTTRAAYRVTPDGERGMEPYEASLGVFMERATATGGGIAAYVKVVGDPVVDRFCVLGQDGSFVPDRCVDVPFTFLRAPVLVPHGTGFRAYVAFLDALEQWTYDDAPAFLSRVPIADLRENGIEHLVIGAATTSSEDLVFTSGRRPSGCVTIYRHLVSTSHAREDLFPEPWMRRGLVTGPAVSPTGEVAYLARATCATPDCEPSVEGPATWILTRREPQGSVSQDQVALSRAITDGAVFFDGEDVVSVHLTSLRRAALWRFRRDGTAAIHDLELPLGREGLELADVTNGMAVGPNEYVLAYTQRGATGLEARLARVTIE